MGNSFLGNSFLKFHLMKVHFLHMKIPNETSPKNNTCSGNLVPRAFPSVRRRQKSPGNEDGGMDLDHKDVHNCIKLNCSLNII